MPFIFGAITVASGILGVVAGPYVAKALRSRYARVDPLVCAAGLLLSVPFMTAALFLARTSVTAAYVMVFFAEFFLNLNWAVVADILLVTVSTGHNLSAAPLQLLNKHGFMSLLIVPLLF